MFFSSGKTAEYQAAYCAISCQCVSKEIVVAHDHCRECRTCLTACPLSKVISQQGCRSIQSIATKECINCGACLQNCPQEAVDYQDDIQLFLHDLALGVPMSLLVAPAVRRHFADYRQIFGFLKTLGIRSFYNVLLRADITIWAYLQILRRQQGTPLISSPCAAVTGYILKHAPRLKQHLMPIYSPLLCAAIYLKKYKHVQEKLAFLSPCIAKRSEIRLSRVNQPIVHYNVTIGKLKQYLLRSGIDLNKYQPIDFDDAYEGNGQTLGFHGGICESIAEYLPFGQYNKISGTDTVYNYLAEYQAALQKGSQLPALLEVYNCAAGCDKGTGVGAYAQEGLSDSQEKTNYRKENVELTFQRFNKELELSDFIWKNLC